MIFRSIIRICYLSNDFNGYLINLNSKNYMSHRYRRERSNSKQRSRAKKQQHRSSKYHQKNRSQSSSSGQSSRSRSRSRSSMSSNSSQSSRRHSHQNRRRDNNSSRYKQQKSYKRIQSKRQQSNEQRQNQQKKQLRQNKQPKSAQSQFKVQETKTLCIEAIKSEKQHQGHSQVQKVLFDISITVGTSVPDQIDFKQGNAYAKYPSVQVSSKIFQHISENFNGWLPINGKKFKVYYYPIKKVDLTIAYDWYCDKCDYKNFARRMKCYRCDNQKNFNCKLNYNSQSQLYATKVKPQKDESVNNCSLMIRGNVITQIQQEYLLQIFQKMAPIKDIRMIKNKASGGYKDFAFVQFYSQGEAASVLKIANQPNFKIQGEKVTVMYSKTRAQDDFVRQPFDKRQKRPEKKKAVQPAENYYKKQREKQIELQKQRPLITMEQLKQKRQQQLKKNAPVSKQMTSQQNKRRQAQLQARQFQKQMKMQNSIMYICPLCKRKFKDEEQMKAHQSFSQYHKYNLAQYLNNKSVVQV